MGTVAFGQKHAHKKGKSKTRMGDTREHALHWKTIGKVTFYGSLCLMGWIPANDCAPLFPVASSKFDHAHLPLQPGPLKTRLPCHMSTPHGTQVHRALGA